MTDLNTKFFAILTAIGEAKQANAAALGTAWTFAQMAVGDANGTDPIPSRTQTKLINELRRAPLNQVKVDPANASVIIAEQIIPEGIGGWWVREIALYDADGDMVAVANCAPTYKPLLSQGSGRTQVIRVNLIVSSTANIELRIDPSIVLATREYVDTVVVEALSKLDYKHSVLVATTANIVLSGIQTVDGEVLPAGARVLVKDQAQGKDNGIYIVPAAGAWKRAQDADTTGEVTPGLLVRVEKGTVSGDSVWQLVTDAPIVLGTTALVFEMVAGRTGVTAGTFRSVTVDKYGRIIAGTTPNSLSGYGIEISSQAEAESQADQDNTKPMTALRVWQAMAKRLTQATEATFGWAKIATQSQTNSGVDDTAFITPKKFSAGLNALVVQSTELLKGIAKIASQTQVDLGLDDTTIVTPQKMRFGFTMSFTAASGYVLFPTWLGGLLIQYGRVSLPGDTGQLFTWPLAWPDACYSLSGGVLSALARQEDSVTPQFRLLTKTNVVIERQDSYTVTANNRDIFVLGVGK